MGIIDTTLGFIERTASTWRHRRAASRAWEKSHRAGAGESFFSRVLASATGGWGWPGLWAREKLEYPQHFRHWTYVAVDCRATKISEKEPNLAWVEPEDPHRHGTQEKRWRMARYQKSHGAIKPHEKETPVPDSHPLKRLFRRPNAWDTAGIQDILYQTEMFLCLAGEAFWWFVPDKNTGLPCEWWVVPPHWCWQRLNSNGVYQVDVRPFPGGAATIFIPWDEIVYFQKPSPLAKLGGWSTQRAISEWSDNSEAICQSQFWSMKNGLNPQGAIELGENFQDPTDEELERIYLKFFIRFQGEFNHGKPIIMPPGAKFTPLEIMPKEMMFNESAEHQRDNILASWRVPKEIAGLQDAGSEIAMWGPRCQFYEDAIKPRHLYISAVATNRVCTRWDHRLRWWWDNPNDSSPEQRRADHQLLATNGAITTNELRGAYSFDPMSDEEEAKYSKLLQKQGMGMPGAPTPGLPPTVARDHPRLIHDDHHGKGWSAGIDAPPLSHPAGGARGVTLLDRARLKEAEQHRYGVVMFELPAQVRDRVKLLASAIEERHLTEKGIEASPHITVLYGLGDADADKIARLLANVRPFKIQLGAIERFPDVQESAVLFVKADGEDLHALHHYLADQLPHMGEIGSYYPHITLAYLLPGTAELYQGPSGLEEDDVLVDRLVYSTPAGTRHVLRLTGGQRQEGVAVALPAEVLAVAKRMRGAMPVSGRQLVEANGAVLKNGEHHEEGQPWESPNHPGHWFVIQDGHVQPAKNPHDTMGGQTEPAQPVNEAKPVAQQGGENKYPQGEIDFTPAKDVKDAAAFAKKNLVADQASFAGLSLDVANGINRQLSRRMNQLPVLREAGLDEISTLGRDDELMGIHVNEHTGGTALIIMKHMGKQARWDRFHAFAQKDMAAGKPPYTVIGYLPKEEALGASIDHEIGHLLATKNILGTEWEKEWNGIHAEEKDSLHKLSESAALPVHGPGIDGEEAFCESVSLILNDRADMVPEKARTFITEFLGL